MVDQIPWESKVLYTITTNYLNFESNKNIYKVFLLEIEKEERKSFPRKNGSFVVTLIYQRLQPFCPVVFGSFDYVFVGSNQTSFVTNR